MSSLYAVETGRIRDAGARFEIAVCDVYQGDVESPDLANDIKHLEGFRVVLPAVASDELADALIEANVIGLQQQALGEVSELATREPEAPAEHRREKAVGRQLSPASLGRVAEYFDLVRVVDDLNTRAAQFEAERVALEALSRPLVGSVEDVLLSRSMAELTPTERSGMNDAAVYLDSRGEHGK
jgi:hypothetical protein